MAYQTRQRDPLLDEATHAALVRRGAELLGLALLALGAALAALTLSYTPDDPNWMAASSAVPQNLLGRTGASVAAILMMIVGYGALILPIVCIAWGLRCVLHAGAERAVPRIFLVPIVLALGSIYAASHVPPPEWTHSFGLGGLFGDTVLAAVLNALPLAAETGLRLVAGAAFLGAAAMLFHVVGVSAGELRAAIRFLIYGLLASLGMVAAGVRGMVSGMAGLAGRLREARAARREQTIPDEGEEDEEFDLDEEFDDDRPAGFFARLVRPRSRDADAAGEGAWRLEPELVERGQVPFDDEVAGPDEDRVRARISDAIRSRVRRPSAVTAAVARRATQGGSDPLTLSPALRAEPPLTAEGADAAGPDWDHEDDNIFSEDGITAPDVGPRIPRAQLQRRVVQHAVRRTSTPSRQAMADAQPSLPLQAEAEEYEFPPLTLLTSPETVERHHLSDAALEENARMLESVLDDYGVKGDIVSVRPGPVVTMYELEPAPGLKASRVIGLADDIARSMSALSARVSTVPGRSVIGIELPNQHREKVVLREILSHRDFGDGTHRLPLALGKDIGGDPVVANLAKMPHLLIAGTTGSGKSVAINTMILSLLYKLTPEDCRMIMIDPKMLELSVYDGIPHLLSPVVTDPRRPSWR